VTQKSHFRVNRQVSHGETGYQVTTLNPQTRPNA
jgi:hypothetical protein